MDRGEGTLQFKLAYTHLHECCGVEPPYLVHVGLVCVNARDSAEEVHLVAVITHYSTAMVRLLGVRETRRAELAVDVSSNVDRVQVFAQECDQTQFL